MNPLQMTSRFGSFNSIEPLEARIAPADITALNLSTLDGMKGFKISGESTIVSAGRSVSSAGDLNGDGFDDVVIGACRPDAAKGGQSASYVIFGKAAGFPSTLDLALLDGAGNGFKITGEKIGDHFGVTVSSAGDVNGDGFDDLLIGAPGAGVDGSGAAYVIFGKAGAFPATLNLSTLAPADGFRISGVTAGDAAGKAVSTAGDINGDGFDDVLIGAPGADSNGSESGASYLILGRAGGFPGHFSLSTLNGLNGFKIHGEGAAHYAGEAVSGAGDLNGDGFDDLLIGASGTDPHGTNSGASYVVFGKGTRFQDTLELTELNGSNGFRINGVAARDNSGFAVSAAGDFNGDGFDDVLIGAPSANAHGKNSGATYLVFGKSGSFAAEFDLSSLDGSTGFKLSGEALENYSGADISGAGDVNGDGFDDLLIGAHGVSNFTGASYVIFGHHSGVGPNVDLATLSGTQGQRINGETPLDGAGFSVAGAGDVNGDGFADLVIGAPRFSGTTSAGYVVFGSQTIVIGTQGKTAMFTDVDGDLVTIQVSKGTILASDVILSTPNVLGGATFQTLNLSAHTDLAAADLSITANRGPHGGDGLVNLGFLNAPGIVLGAVSIDGDLGRIHAGTSSNPLAPGVKSLNVNSMGLAGLTTQTVTGASLVSVIEGNLGALTVESDIRNATLVLRGGAGTIKLGGTLEGAHLLIRGSALPLALKSLTVEGSVLGSQILAGYDLNGGVNADAQIGSVTVNGNWLASDLAAGILATDGAFGDANDAVIAGGNASIRATIGSVVIKGQAVGTFEPGGSFGIVAESIGAMSIGKVKLPLTTTDGEVFRLGPTGDFQMREISGPATALNGSTPWATGQAEGVGLAGEKGFYKAGAPATVDRIASLLGKGETPGFTEGRSGIAARAMAGVFMPGRILFPSVAAFNALEIP